jgi:hypothetical protein
MLILEPTTSIGDHLVGDVVQSVEHLHDYVGHTVPFLSIHRDYENRLGTKAIIWRLALVGNL